jgi:hypothetical protein
MLPEQELCGLHDQWLYTVSFYNSIVDGTGGDSSVPASAVCVLLLVTVGHTSSALLKCVQWHNTFVQ